MTTDARPVMPLEYANTSDLYRVLKPLAWVIGAYMGMRAASYLVSLLSTLVQVQSINLAAFWADSWTFFVYVPELAVWGLTLFNCVGLARGNLDRTVWVERGVCAAGVLDFLSTMGFTIYYFSSGFSGGPAAAWFGRSLLQALIALGFHAVMFIVLRRVRLATF